MKPADVQKLRALVKENKAYAAIFKHLAEHGRPNHTTDIRRIRYALNGRDGFKLSPEENRKLFKKLESMGFGNLEDNSDKPVPPGKTNSEPDRFHWDKDHTNIQVARMALGLPEQEGPVPRGFSKVGYITIIVTGGREVSLPPNLTKEDAKKISAVLFSLVE